MGIDNPDFKNDSSIGFYPDISVLAFELWQVKAGTLFDAILVTDDEEYARAYGNESFHELFWHEKKFRDEAIRASIRKMYQDTDGDEDDDDDEDGDDDDDDDHDDDEADDEDDYDYEGDDQYEDEDEDEEEDRGDDDNDGDDDDSDSSGGEDGEDDDDEDDDGDDDEEEVVAENKE